MRWFTRSREEDAVVKIELGSYARDTITGYEGVVVARTEWLHGCVRVTVQSRALHDGKPVESHTFDEPQVEVVEEPGRRRPAAPTGGPYPEPRRAPAPSRR